MAKVYGVVYLLIDGTNDMEYVGQTTRSVEERFKEHARYDNSYIDNAIRAHGEDLFVTVILKECANKKELDFWERYFIRSRNTISPNGYNLTEGGEGGIPCEKTRKKMSEAQKGREVSIVTRKKLSEALSGEKNPRFGKKNTPEHQARIVAACRGKRHTPETCANVAAALKGKHLTIERCSNISIAKRSDSPYKNLLSELDARQMSYAALAKLMGVVSSIVSRKMTCVRRFTARDAVKLEEIFGKPADYLLQCDEKVLAKASEPRCDNSPYENLLRELDARQMSYTELAELLNLKPSSIIRKMSNERKFTAKELVKLAEIFGKPAEYLLARGDVPVSVSAAKRSDSPYKNLLRELDARQMSYTELSKILGVVSSGVSNKMNGRQNFTRRDVVKLEEIFGKPADYLLARDDG